jgi:hypothetical protein
LKNRKILFFRIFFTLAKFIGKFGFIMAFSTLLRRAASKTCAPLLASSAAAAFLHQSRLENESRSQCDAAKASTTTAAAPKFAAVATDANLSSPSKVQQSNGNRASNLKFEQELAFVPGMQPDVEGDFYGLFPLRQLWVPTLTYPLWDKNWDGRHPVSTGDEDIDRQMQRSLRKNGITRHIILVRHGQYDETHKVSAECDK